MIPGWIQLIIAVAALITALGVIIQKVVRPGVRAASTAETMIPLLQSLNVTFKDTPNAFKILNEIIAQFRTDSGSTLRDVVNRLETAALESKMVTEQLRVDVASDRQLDERDRAELREMLISMDRLATQVAVLITSGIRIEADRALVAEALTIREKMTDSAIAGVASDLAASQKKADETQGEAGAAADAASQSLEKP